VRDLPPNDLRLSCGAQAEAAASYKISCSAAAEAFLGPDSSKRLLGRAECGSAGSYWLANLVPDFLQNARFVDQLGHAYSTFPLSKHNRVSLRFVPNCSDKCFITTCCNLA
jgi:hypothetical protein